MKNRIHLSSYFKKKLLICMSGSVKNNYGDAVSNHVLK